LGALGPGPPGPLDKMALSVDMDMDSLWMANFISTASLAKDLCTGELSDDLERS